MFQLLRVFSGGVPLWCLPLATAVVFALGLFSLADRHLSRQAAATTAAQERAVAVEADLARLDVDRGRLLAALAHHEAQLLAARELVQASRDEADQVAAKLNQVRRGLAIRPPAAKPDKTGGGALDEHHLRAIDAVNCLLTNSGTLDHAAGDPCGGAGQPGVATGLGDLPGTPAGAGAADR